MAKDDTIIIAGLGVLGLFLFRKEISTAVGGAAAGAQGLGEGIGTAATGLGTGIAQVSGGLGTAVTGLGSGISQFGENLGEISGAIGETVSALATVPQTFARETAETAGQVFDIGQSALGRVAGGVSSVSGFIGSGLSNIFSGLIDDQPATGGQDPRPQITSANDPSGNLIDFGGFSTSTFPFIDTSALLFAGEEPQPLGPRRSLISTPAAVIESFVQEKPVMEDSGSKPGPRKSSVSISRGSTGKVESGQKVSGTKFTASSAGSFKRIGKGGVFRKAR